MNRPRKAPAPKQSKAQPAPHRASEPNAWLAIVVLAGLVTYSVLYFATPIREIAGDNELRRGDVACFALLRPDDIVRSWDGGTGEIGITDRLPVLAWAVAILLVCTSVGWWLLRVTGALRLLGGLERFTFSVGVGMTAVSLVVLLVGLAGGLQARWVFIGAGAVVLVATALRLAFDWTQRKDASRKRADGSGPIPLTLWLMAPFVAVLVLSAMLPPLDFDVLEYHLQVPKEFYLGGRITFLPHNVYGNMPLASEMLSLLAMIVTDDWRLGALVGKTVLSFAVPTCGLALFAAGRRTMNDTAGVVAALAFVSTPWILRVGGSGLVEGMSALLLWLALHSWLVWQGDRDVGAWPGLALVGFLAGGAVAIKYPAAVFVAVPVAMLVVARLWLGRPIVPLDDLSESHDSGEATEKTARSWRNIVAGLAVFALAAVVTCGPWLAKNALLTGNPVYPLLAGWLGGETRTPEKQQQWNRAHSPPDYQLSSAANSVLDVTYRSSWQSAIIVPLAAIGFFVRRYRAIALLLAGYLAFVLVAWWLFTHRIERFWVPFLPAAAMLAGVGATWFAAGWQRAMLWGWLGIMLVASGLFAIAGGGGDNAYIAPLEVLRDQAARVSPYHLWINKQLRPGDRVLSVSDAAVFDIEVPVAYNTVFDDCLFEALMRDRTGEERRAALDALGITHVYVNWAEIDRYRGPGNYGFTDYVQPELFDELLDQGVLARILYTEPIAEKAIYQVQPARLKP